MDAKKELVISFGYRLFLYSFEFRCKGVYKNQNVSIKMKKNTK